MPDRRPIRQMARILRRTILPPPTAAALVGLVALPFLLLPERGEAQDSAREEQPAQPSPDGSQRSFSLETGIINFGPLVTRETENFVRFGSNGGMETYFALSLEASSYYVRLLLAPTQVHVWPTDETSREFFGVEKSTDPRRSRFDYRVRGSPRDSFVWSSFSGGWRFERSAFSLRLGGGGVTLSQTSHSYWGARVGIAPMLEAAAGVHWRALEASCGGQLLGLGFGGGRWIVLEHAAGNAPNSGARSSRIVRPVHCGLNVRL